MKEVQEAALQSLVSNKSNKPAAANDNELQQIVNKKYAAGYFSTGRGSMFERRSTASVTNVTGSIIASPRFRQ